MEKGREGVNQILWAYMTNPEFSERARHEGLLAAVESQDLQLNEAEREQLSNIDIEDLQELTNLVERDLTLMMGGSRPRSRISLSESAVEELESALREARESDR